MLLQLALDTPHAGTVRRLLDETAGDVDIIELGTPLLIRYGVDIIAGTRRDHPDKKILADLKIADAGAVEAGLAFDAGADIVTVLGTAHPATLREAGDRAKRSGGQVMADLITAREVDEAVSLARRMDRAGLDYICMHTAFDARGQSGPGGPGGPGDPARNLEGIGRVGAAVERAGLAVAGGLDPALIKRLIPHGPDIVVVGGYITGNADPGRAVRAIRRIMEIVHRADG
ncbi:MAG: 3-hexulose-6-phosphate synthase [Gemmatimonadetes bacterium]|nr:3-hexulose-6-phosphate synthase [Gemmatimonadota bacterium]MYD26857.1 3-hexulose-6-phosphate synthase [Gemmatimonadota bacterium]MYI99076.1 3-hexulose-6-phosphate synthase [Gemmatimonadota bacterium]